MNNHTAQFTSKTSVTKAVIYMGKSKKDLTRRRANIKEKLSILEPKAKMDPLKKHPEIHEEIAKLKKELEES